VSLLLKALQKAGEERTGGQAASAPSPRELTLQPADHVSTARKPIYTDPSPAQAAAILAAGSPRTRVADYVRERPLIVFSVAAASFLIAYGSYVYVQLVPPTRVNYAPSPVANQPIPGSSSPTAFAATAALPGAALQGTASPGQPRVTSKNSSPIASAQAVQLPSAEPATRRVASSVAAVAKSPANGSAESVPNDSFFPDINATRNATPGAHNRMIDESSSVQPVSPPRPKQTAVTITKLDSASTFGFEPAHSIDVSRETPAVRVDQDLADAYQALQSGHHTDAEARYKKLAQAEPNNADVLLGLAAVAIQQTKSEQASEYYFRILESDPKNALAQAGLIAVGGQADRQNAETRLKQLIDREPSAFLYFVLGNLYADQSQWAAAQAAYFQAHHLRPDHPDYAFNLAIGLEHLSQRKLSVDYYRRALSLVALRGNASFDAASVERHVAALAAVAE